MYIINILKDSPQNEPVIFYIARCLYYHVVRIALGFMLQIWEIEKVKVEFADLNQIQIGISVKYKYFPILSNKQIEYQESGYAYYVVYGDIKCYDISILTDLKHSMQIFKWKKLIWDPLFALRWYTSLSELPILFQ